MSENNLDYWINKFEATSFYEEHHNKLCFKLNNGRSQFYHFLVPFHGEISIDIPVYTLSRNPEDNCFITEKHFGHYTEPKEFPLTDEGLSEAIKDLRFKATQTN